MARFDEVFGATHAVLPVIHVESLALTLRNADVAMEAGCDGVFLIGHGKSHSVLLDIQRQVKRAHPLLWTGVNCLDLHPVDVFSVVDGGVDGVWTDNAGIDERECEQSAAERLDVARRGSGWSGLYFGGIAFKYQRDVEDLVRAAEAAVGFMDVATTSGPGTGMAAARGKIEALRQGLGEHPMAIASGITPENVGDYLGLADAFLVATGISSDFTHLDPARVRALVSAVRSCAGLRPRKRMDSQPFRVCFVCEWNEGRSAHLELGVRERLGLSGSRFDLTSAGFQQGGGINTLRRRFLVSRGIPESAVVGHRSTVFGESHARADLVLVAEQAMKARLTRAWPRLEGRVMTVRGFADGLLPIDDESSLFAADIPDADGYDSTSKLLLYEELEDLADRVASRLADLDVSRWRSRLLGKKHDD